eukprot:COSAG06_NODE_659_length_13318_cov_37.619941_4_plen_86_part_00
MIVDESPAWRLLLRLLAAKPAAAADVVFVSYNPCFLIMNMVDAPELFADEAAFLCNMAGGRIGALRIKAQGRARGFRCEKTRFSF